MTDYHWATIYNRAVELFGETPSAQLEADVLEHFEQTPARVADQVEAIGAKVAAGKVRSGWAVLRAELNRPTTNRTITDTNERTKRIDKAKQWIRNAGLHYDRQDHVLADLFGDQYAKGPLTNHDTPELRTELANYWLEHRPRGQQAEADHEAWNTKARADRELVLALKPKRPDTITSPDIDFDT